MSSCAFNRHTLIPAQVIRSWLTGAVRQPLQLEAGGSRPHRGPGSVSAILQATKASVAQHHYVCGQWAERQVRLEAEQAGQKTARGTTERFRELEEKLRHFES